MRLGQEIVRCLQANYAARQAASLNPEGILPQRRVKSVQALAVRKLSQRFGDACVEEWPAFTGAGRPYSPRLDIAVGPFAVEELKFGSKYDRLQIHHRAFLKTLWRYHEQNLVKYNGGMAVPFDHAIGANHNARCFLAIEIENAVSRKHLMGGAVNATALGRLGIIVGWTDEKVKALVQLWRYLNYLGTHEKPTFPLANLFILSRGQLLRSL